MSTLAQIREKLKAIEEKKSGNNNKGKDLSYRFWDMKEGESATIRFLPDKNEDNTFFWKEIQQIRIPFPGVKGGNTSKEVVVTVPCMDMFGESCPILVETRPWWDDASLKPLAQKYWKKRSYVFQGIVKDSPLQEEVPENPIRKFVFTTQIFNIIKGSLLDPDMENIPTDLLNGTDFRLVKGTKAGWADYSTSNWSRRESSLNETELEAINQYGLQDLNDYAPKKPNAEELAAIYDMFQDSVNGELYDPAKYAKYYKPYGLEYNATAAPQQTAPVSAPAQVAPVSAPVQETVTSEIPFDLDTPKVSAPSGESKSAQDILDMIRKRNTNN